MVTVLSEEGDDEMDEIHRTSISQQDTVHSTETNDLAPSTLNCESNATVCMTIC